MDLTHFLAIIEVGFFWGALYGYHLAIFSVVSKECQAFVKVLTEGKIPEPVNFTFTARMPPLARLHVEHYRQSDFAANLLRHALNHNHTLTSYNGFTGGLYDFMLDYGARIINNVITSGVLADHDSPRFIDTIIGDRIRFDLRQSKLTPTMLSTYSKTILHNEEYYIRNFFTFVHPDFEYSTASLVQCLRSLIANGVPVRTFRTDYFDGLLESILEARYISKDTKDALVLVLTE
jgi:hypothetical protein